ncbi:hypothetical protein FN846DRAFT_896625 [Sphaerosporella brunnea]|uniref:Uncharacterized protein n=1 Tax=Sphaerosporella brunnea TaxID=1250544 RepID=A0A5J5EBM7_9PEZI|nr:hypothetical protein FN846DRAFT_896625 [Sphaerosporella brunnea]
MRGRFPFFFSVPALLLTLPACCPIHSVLTLHSLIMPRPSKKAKLLKAMRAKRRQNAQKQKLLRYLLSCSRCKEHDYLLSESDEDSDLEDDATIPSRNQQSISCSAGPSRNLQSSSRALRNEQSISRSDEPSRNQQGISRSAGPLRNQQSSPPAATLDLSSLKWNEGADKSLFNCGVSQGGKSRNTQKRNRKNVQALQKAASESCSIVKLWQRQRLLGISFKSLQVKAEEDRQLEAKEDSQPNLLVVENCASGVLDPRGEKELAMQTQIQDIKDASQAIDRLLWLKTEQKKVYGQELGVYSAWRCRHLMVQSFLWLEAIQEKVGGRRRERAVQIA